MTMAMAGRIGAFPHMMTLYFFPQLCSMASHIVLEESGLPYRAQVVDILKGEQRRPEYLAINPAGQVPALVLEDGVPLTETVAIMDYVAAMAPDKALAPTEPQARARWLSALVRMASAIHPVFTRVVRADMVVEDEAARVKVSETARKRYADHLRELDALFADGPWLLGAQYTTADAHALVLFNWGKRAGFSMDDYPRLSRWKERMVERPAVRTVLEQEGSPLIAVPA